MWRFFMTVFLVGIVCWVVLDAIYWGFSDFTALLPHRRYFAVVTIAAVVAVMLWAFVWGLRKFLPKHQR